MKAERTYKIGEFAAMTGMAPSKVRFYEKAGLFPVRRAANGYRYFTSQDAFRANAFRVLLQYGFTVEQAIEMLDAKQETDEFASSLFEQRERLQRQADLLLYRQKRIEGALELLNHRPGRRFTVVDVDDQLYVRASRGSDFSVAVENEREIALFYELLSVTNCARIIARSDFDSDAETIDPSYVITMPIHEEHRLAGCDMCNVHRLVMGKCLRFRRRLTREESLRKESFDEMFEYLASHGYRLRGDILLLPAFLNLDGKGSDIETLLAPIE